MSWLGEEETGLVTSNFLWRRMVKRPDRDVVMVSQ